MDATFGGVPPAAPGTVSAFSLGSLAHAIALAGRSTRPLRAGGHEVSVLLDCNRMGSVQRRRIHVARELIVALQRG